MLFDGLCAFPITPASADGIVDTTSLDSLIRCMTDAGVDSIGLLGSTGTAPYFTRAERSRAVRAAAHAARDTPLMVGIGALRTDHAVSLACDAAAEGAQGLLLPPISYIPLTEEEVYRHCATVAAATNLPLCLYNNPAATHFTFTPALTARLSRVARIAAVKNPAPLGNAADELAALRREAAPGFSIGVSVDWRAADAMLAGANAWYSVLAGILPGPCVAIARAIREGDAVRARGLNAALEPIWALFQEYTSLRTVYAMADLLGISDAQPPLPIQALDAAARTRIAAVLDAMRKEESASF